MNVLLDTLIINELAVCSPRPFHHYNKMIVEGVNPQNVFGWSLAAISIIAPVSPTLLHPLERRFSSRGKHGRQ